MRYFRAAVVFVLCMSIAPKVSKAAELIPPNATVGRNLQASATIGVGDGAPDEGLEIRLTSNDPSRLLLSNAPDAAGAAELVLKVNGGFRQSREFWIQALGGSGSVTYTAIAPGFAPANGTVTLAPSGLILIGPFGAPRFVTTSRAMPSRLTIMSVLLDASLKYVAEQAVAGGRSVAAELRSSDTGVGTIADPLLTIAGGDSAAETQFQPSNSGTTILSASVPPGFSPLAQSASLTAVVSEPGLAVTDGVAIGQNLQVGGVLSLGEAAPDSGVTVTLTSGNPEQLLLSATGAEVGSASIEITIPAGAANARYYLQALGSSGTVTYTASSPIHRSRTATITLAPSGVMITPAAYGPPDEGEVLQPEAPEVPRRFVASVSTGTVPLVVWTVQLDPVTKRGADITVQPLRAGLSLNVLLANTNPAIGAVDSQVVIEAGSEYTPTQFTPLSAGSTVISVATPSGFTTPSNGTRVTAFVQP